MKLTKQERTEIRKAFREFKKQNRMDSQECQALIKSPEIYEIYKQTKFLNNPAGNPGGQA